MITDSASPKVCPKCKKCFPRSVFGLRNNGHTQSYCPECRKAYSRETDVKYKRHRASQWDTSKPGIGKSGPTNCPTCGKIFYPVIVNLKRGYGKYCSHQCSIKARKTSTVQMTCRNCNNLFLAKRSEAKRGGGKYCSSECWYNYNTGSNNPLWAEHFTSYRGRGWLGIREDVLARDGYLCQCCGKTQEDEIGSIGRGLSIHHKEEYRVTQNNDIDNLVSMCAACHMKAEWEIRRSKNGKC